MCTATCEAFFGGFNNITNCVCSVLLVQLLQRLKYLPSVPNLKPFIKTSLPKNVVRSMKFLIACVSLFRIFTTPHKCFHFLKNSVKTVIASDLN